MATRTYRVNIIMSGSDKASGVLGKVGKAIGSMGRIIGGILGANLLMKFGQGIKNLGKSAFESVAGYEQLGFTLNTLIARELTRGTVVQKVVKRNIRLSAAERLELLSLEKTYGSLQGKLSLVTAEYDRMARKKGAGSKQALILEAEMDRLTGSIGSQGSRLNFLRDASDGYISSLQNVREGTLTMKEAYAQSGEQAAALLKTIEILAVQSPFDMKTIASAIQMAMAYGLSKDTALSLTRATIDFAAGSGLAADTLTRVARGLGQVQAKGRLMGEEIRQLTDAGIPVLQILADTYGKTTSEVSQLVRQGLVPAHEAIEAITKSLQTDFQGAAERQMETWSGLKNAMEDIKFMGLERIFGGIFDAFKPFAVDFVKFMTGEGLDRLERFGDRAGEGVATFIQKLGIVKTALGQLFTTGELDFSQLFGDIDVSIIDALIVPLKTLETLFRTLAPPIKFIADNMLAFNAGFAAFLLMMLKSASGLGFVVKIFGALKAALLGLGIAIGPAILVGAAIVALVLILQTHGDVIKQWFTDLWNNTILPFFGELLDWFGSIIPGILEFFKGVWESVWGVLSSILITVWGIVQPILMALAILFTTVIWPALQLVGDFLLTVFTFAWQSLGLIWTTLVLPALEFMGMIFTTIIWPVLQLIGRFIAGVIIPVFQGFIAVAQLIAEVIRILALKISTKLQPVLITVKERLETFKKVLELMGTLIRDKVVPQVMQMWEWLKTKLEPVAKFLSSTVFPAVAKGIDGISDAIKWVVEKIKEMVEWLKNIEVPAIFSPGSPTPFELGLRGIGRAINSLNSKGLPQLTMGFADFGENQLGMRMGEFGKTPGMSNSNDTNTTHITIPTVLSTEEMKGVLTDIMTEEGSF